MRLKVNQNKGILSIKYDFFNCTRIDYELKYNNYDEWEHYLDTECRKGADILKQILNELKVLSDKYKKFKFMSYVFMWEIFVDGDDEPIYFKIDGLENDNLINHTLNDLVNLLIINGIKINHKRVIYSTIYINMELLSLRLTNNDRKRTNVPRGLRKEVFKRDNYTCKECGAKKSEGATLHIDHIIPISKGGTDELNNLQTLCSDCNLNKSNIIQ